MSTKPIAILYEHPEWFKPLFAELDRRGVHYQPVHAAEHSFDPGERDVPYSLVVNRMSPSAWTRGHGRAIFQSLHYLAWLDDIGASVVNGHPAFRTELSKARQAALAASLGLRYPRTRVINHHSQAVAAAEDLRYPVLVKPNLAGSGAGVRSFATPGELGEAAANGMLEFGIDQTALVQEHLPAEGDAIIRIEILDGRFLYAIRLLLTPGTFNLCPADYCELPGLRDGVSGRGLPVQAHDPPPSLIEDARRWVAAAGMDLGGVEYLVNERDGRAYFYDLNALSNFVADAPDVVGFDPFVDLVDLIVERGGLRAAMPT